MSEFDTGVEVPEGAAQDGAEPEAVDDTTAFAEEEEAPDISLEELINGTDEGNADEGSGQPAEPDANEKGKQAPKTTQTERAFTQADVDAIVQKRLAQQKTSLEKAQAAKAQADAEIDSKTKEYLKAHPNTELTEDMVKSIFRQQSGPQEAGDKLSAEEYEQQQLAAWNESLTSEEPLLKAALSNPNFSIRAAITEGNPAYNPVLRAALAMKLTPQKALHIMQQAEAYYGEKAKAAKAAGEKEVLEKIKTSNSKTVTPVKSGSGGKPKSVEEYIKTAPYDELQAMLRNGRVRV